MSHTEVINKFGVKCTFLDMLTLRLSIPLHWHNTLSADWNGQPILAGLSGILVALPNEEPRDISTCSAKTFYQASIEQNKWTPTAAKSWTEDQSSPLHMADPEEWKEISLRPRETKLQSLQFKINHRISPCNVYLHQIRIKEMDTCCEAQDSEIHFFFHCEPVKIFWEQIFSWFERVQDLQLKEVSPKEFIIGTPTESQNGKMSNYIIAHTKLFILRQKLFGKGKLDMLHWLREFRDKLDMESYISHREGKHSRFKKWSIILTALG